MQKFSIDWTWTLDLPTSVYERFSSSAKSSKPSDPSKLTWLKLSALISTVPFHDGATWLTPTPVDVITCIMPGESYLPAPHSVSLGSEQQCGRSPLRVAVERARIRASFTSLLDGCWWRACGEMNDDEFGLDCPECRNACRSLRIWYPDLVHGWPSVEVTRLVDE